MNTTDTTCTQAQVDALLGRKIVNYVIAITVQCISLTLAFCCSSFWLGFLVYIVVGLLIGLLAVVGMLYLAMFVSDDSFEALGAKAGSLVSTVTGWFSKQPSPSAQSAS
jgi:MFS family permease